MKLDKQTIVIGFLVVVCFVVLALLLGGCVDIREDTNQQQTPTGSSGGLLPAPNPSSSPSQLPRAPVATVAVGEYAREGGGGPCLTGTSLRVGCAAFITCTPRDSGGVDVGPRYVPDWSEAGSIVVIPTTVNVYNARVTCDHGGVGIAACAVGGVLGSIQYDCVQ